MTQASAKDPTVDEEEFELWCCGDLMPARSFGNAEHSRFFWRTFRDADFVFANLETSLTTSNDRADKAVWLKADPTLAEDLNTLGVNLVTIANNHTMDFGEAGLIDTLKALKSSGIRSVGAGENLEEALRPIVLENRDTRIALLGLTASFAMGAAAASGRPGIAPIHIQTQYVLDKHVLPEEPGMAPHVETSASKRDLARACAAIASAKEDASVVVVALHWGVCFGMLPLSQGWMATYQQPLAHALIEAGADVIVGHGPHVLHGVEVYRGRPIIYSLGNLLCHTMEDGVADMETKEGPAYEMSHMTSLDARLGGVVKFRFRRSTLTHAELKFLSLDEDGNPMWSESNEIAYASGLVTTRSARFGTRLEIDEQSSALEIGLLTDRKEATGDG